MNEHAIVDHVKHPLDVEERAELADKLSYEDTITPERLEELLEEVTGQARL